MLKTKRPFLKLVFFLLAALIVGVTGLAIADVSSTTITTTQLTDNNGHYRDPQINGDYAVWASDEIYLYSISADTTTQVSDTSFRDNGPQTDGDYIVWWGGTSLSNQEIYLYEISSGETTQITDNDSSDRAAQIDGNYVVWGGNVAVRSQDPEIFLYNIESGDTAQLTDNSYYESYPEISGNYVTWSASDGNDREIYVYDIAAGETTQITDNAYHDYAPQIDGNKVAWTSSAPSDAIILYDIANETTTQTAIGDAGIGSELGFDGNNIVWTNEELIFFYDGSSVTTITPATDWVDDPEIAGSNIVWWGGPADNSDSDIFLYDGSNITTASGGWDYWPHIDGNHIVWTGDNANWSPQIHLGTIRNTLAGAIVDTVTVGLSNNISVEFSDVTADGYTSYTTDTTDTTPAAGFAVIGNQYDITTTAEYAAPVLITLPYDEAEVVGSENDLKIYHWNGASWDDVTVSVDTINNTITGQANSLSPFVVAQPELSMIAAELTLAQETLNLKSKGSFVAGYIELSQGYDVADVDINTVRLNGVKAEPSPTEIGDHDRDGVPDLMVKFDRTAIQNAVGTGEAIDLTVFGALPGAIGFMAVDAIRVIDKGKGHINQSDPSSVVY